MEFAPFSIKLGLQGSPPEENCDPAELFTSAPRAGNLVALVCSLAGLSEAADK